MIEKTREFLKGRQVGLVDGAWLGGIPGVYWWPTYATSGGQIVEQNIHLFDMLRYLFGEPERVYCAAARGIVKRDGTTCTTIRPRSSPSRTRSSPHCSPVLPGPQRAEQERLHIRCADADIRYILRQSVELDTGSYVELHRREIEQGVTEDRTFLDAVKTNNPAIIRSPYADACKSLALTLACNESIATGEEIVLD